jgi:hypothetical protein
MKNKVIMLLLLSSLVFSCGTGPKPDDSSSAPEPAVSPVSSEPSEPEVRKEEAPKEYVFDPNSITEEVFVAVKTDITALIADLNRIIRARNYNGWVAHLADSYLREISSSYFLEEKTEELYRRDQIVAQNAGRDPNMVVKRILKTARDYFDYVVVPSRANDRLDDISFLSETRVRAYTIDERRGGQRLVLYDLASINNEWMIIH